MVNLNQLSNTGNFIRRGDKEKIIYECKIFLSHLKTCNLFILNKIIFTNFSGNLKRRAYNFTRLSNLLYDQLLCSQHPRNHDDGKGREGYPLLAHLKLKLNFYLFYLDQYKSP